MADGYDAKPSVTITDPGCGFTPGALLALLALTLGATDVLGLLLAVSLFSGGIGSAISGSAAAAAKRVGPGDREDQPKLPAT